MSGYCTSFNRRTAFSLSAQKNVSSTKYLTAVSGDSKLVACCEGEDSSISFWHAHSGRLAYRVETNGLSVDCLDLSKDGSMVACANDQEVTIWQLQMRSNPTMVGTVEVGSHVPRLVKFAPDGSALAIASYDESVSVWNLESGLLTNVFSVPQEFDSIDNVYSFYPDSLEWSPDSKLLACGAMYTRLRIWEVATGTLLGYGPWDTCCLVFDRLGTRVIVAKMGDSEVPCLVHEIHSKDCYTVAIRDGPVTALALSPDDKYLLSTCIGDFMIILDLFLGTELRLPMPCGLHSGMCNIAWAPNGMFFVSDDKDGRTSVWDFYGEVCSTFM